MRLQNPEAYVRAEPPKILAKVGEEIRRETSFIGSVLDPAALAKVPQFTREEVQTGRVVGRGGFCVVEEITAIRLQDGLGNKNNSSGHGRTLFRRGTESQASDAGSESKLSSNSADNKRELVARQVWSKRSSKYVLKQVEPNLLTQDTVTYLRGTIDIGLEAYFLASLNHNNILQLRGISATGPAEGLGYFIILDHLQEILSKRLNSWMQQKRASNGITGAVTGGKRHKKRILMERILVAYDVADALDYLHRKNIIYRDLKHDNIGFDADGIVKIFDFGLAKELQESEKGEDGLYHMTGLTGALRYMAPEVGLEKPYNQKADVYSWSMLMWFFMALEPPLGMYTQRMFLDRVFQKGYRPAIKAKWPEEVSSLIRQCWDENPHTRPGFDEIKGRLKDFARSVDPEISSLMGKEIASLMGKV